jgi:hypothetical protein
MFTSSNSAIQTLLGGFNSPIPETIDRFICLNMGGALTGKTMTTTNKPSNLWDCDLEGLPQPTTHGRRMRIGEMVIHLHSHRLRGMFPRKNLRVGWQIPGNWNIWADYTNIFEKQHPHTKQLGITFAGFSGDVGWHVWNRSEPYANPLDWGPPGSPSKALTLLLKPSSLGAARKEEGRQWEETQLARYF